MEGRVPSLFRCHARSRPRYVGFPRRGRGRHRYGPPLRTRHPRRTVPAARAIRHYKFTTTTAAALRTTGLRAFRLNDGATNGQRFRSYVADGLVPMLQTGDTVILDDLQAHKVAGARGDRGGGCAGPQACALKSQVQSYRADLRKTGAPAHDCGRPRRERSLGSHRRNLHWRYPQRGLHLPRSHRL